MGLESENTTTHFCAGVCQSAFGKTPMTQPVATNLGTPDDADERTQQYVTYIRVCQTLSSRF